MLRKRPDWSRPLPRALIIPSLMTLKTLADVRELLRHLPAERKALDTWRYVATRLEEAARGADAIDVAVSLRLVLALEHIPCRSK
jgi:hypothetical protein